MIYVGIDIAKLNHVASIMNSDGEILLEPFGFTNDHSDFLKVINQPYLIIKAFIMNKYRLFTERDLESLKLKNLTSSARSL